MIRPVSSSSLRTLFDLVWDDVVFFEFLGQLVRGEYLIFVLAPGCFLVSVKQRKQIFSPEEKSLFGLKKRVPSEFFTALGENIAQSLKQVVTEALAVLSGFLAHRERRGFGRLQRIRRQQP